METVVQREETALTPSGTICRCRQEPSKSQLIPWREGSTALPTRKRNIVQALMVCLCPCNIKSSCALCTQRRIEELALQEANPPQSIHCLVQQKNKKELRANECNSLYPHAKSNDAHCTLPICVWVRRRPATLSRPRFLFLPPYCLTFSNSTTPPQCSRVFFHLLFSLILSAFISLFLLDAPCP